VIAAVMEARRTGRGAFLDFSQREVASFTIGEEILAASADRGRRQSPQGNRQDGIAQQDTYRCKDGRWIAVTLPASDPSIGQFCAERDHQHAIADLHKKGVAAALCNDGADLLKNQALAGVTLARDGRRTLVKGLPYLMNGRGITIERPAPELGEHTQSVLRALLGYDDAKLKQLADAGVTSTTPTIGEV
jgi:benzylsuccinate CoA-transferase BbsF subunit